MNTRDTFFLVGACLAVALVFARCTSACAGAKSVEAAASYEAQQLRCVDKYMDREGIDVCRAKVRDAWIVDGGKDGAP